MTSPVYLDNAATTYPKPKNVKAVLCSCLDTLGNPGRSSHALSLNSAKLMFSCRELICSLFNFDHPENVIFTYNTTYALNMAIYGLFDGNGEIIISNLEHNSVLRPVHAICERSKQLCSYKAFNALGSDNDVVESFNNSLSDATVLAVVTACSNVTGKLLPIRQIGEICRKRGIKLIIDAAQSAGIVPLDLQNQHFSAVCFAGHKSLYGIMGSGFCIFAEGENPKAHILGGNGTMSLSPTQDGVLPERLESGTAGVVAIAALREGIKHIICVGQEQIYDVCSSLSEILTQRLKNMANIRIIGECENKVGTVLFNVEGYDSENVAAFLSQKGICVRGGFHCSALAHASLGTTETGGAVRASFSHFNTQKDVDAITDALKEFHINAK